MKVFDSVAVKAPDKNVFTLDHDVKASYNFDKLYPFLCQPVYPGDTFNCRAEVFLRAMPMFAPVMHNVDMKFYFFYVPYRLLWNENKKKDWKIFITGGEDGLQDAVMPHFTYGAAHNAGVSMADGSLLDHMGFPTFATFANMDPNTSNIPISSLPFRAYQLVWNEYFRNQNVQNEIEFSYDEGAETADNIRKLFHFRYKCWEKDYFTSCLPFAQRGEAVRLPIAPYGSETNQGYDPDMSTAFPVEVAMLSRIIGNQEETADVESDGGANKSGLVASHQVTAGKVSLKGYAHVNASEITFTGLSIGTINDFRYCVRLQQWLENNARCGSRYIEQLLSHFGVVSSDARLQRPELLGGGSVPLIFSDVEQNAAGNDSSLDTLGTLAGKGTLYGKTQGFKKYFEEHGLLLGITCIIPRTSYQQGLPRVWTAMDKTDFYFPEFAHLGEQAVYNYEVYYNPLAPVAGQPSDNPLGVFGYQGRFTELRYIPSTVHGQLRNSLQYWHLGRVFPLEPSLNSNFVEANSRVNIFAVEDIRDGREDPFVAQIHLDISAVRPLPKYAVPTL